MMKQKLKRRQRRDNKPYKRNAWQSNSKEERMRTHRRHRSAGKGNRKDRPKPLVENVLVPKNNKPSMQDKMKSALKALKDGATKNGPQEDEFPVYDATSDGEESEGQE